MTIFVDMDEVIADTYGALIKLYNYDFQENLSLKECWGKEVWKAVPSERQASIKKHPNTIGFFRNLTPIEDAQKVLKELTLKHDVYIASAAMQFPNSLLEKSEWLDEHFSFLPWQKRILCGDKHILKGDVLIDDRNYNLERFDGRSLQFTSGHNVNTNGFERVNTWLEVADILL